jgi:hypothetical protein
MIRKTRIRKRREMKMVRRGTKCLRKKKDADRCTKKSRNLEHLRREEGLLGSYEIFSDHRLLME